MIDIEEEQDFLMPEACRKNIDLVHMDKGKIITVGNYESRKKSGNREDMVCLLDKTSDRPLTSLRLDINDTRNVDYFALYHHGLHSHLFPGWIERWARMPFILFTMTAGGSQRPYSSGT
jgi:hypothetical protein